jgi:predicted negative regulator of RcsB-dependent stress response
MYILTKGIKVIILLLLAVIFFFGGRWYQKQKDEPQIKDYATKVTIAEMELKATRIEHQLKITEIQLNYEKVKSSIDTMGVAAIDSLFSKYGF